MKKFLTMLALALSLSFTSSSQTLDPNDFIFKISPSVFNPKIYKETEDSTQKWDDNCKICDCKRGVEYVSLEKNSTIMLYGLENCNGKEFFNIFYNGQDFLIGRYDFNYLVYNGIITYNKIKDLDSSQSRFLKDTLMKLSIADFERKTKELDSIQHRLDSVNNLIVKIVDSIEKSRPFWIYDYYVFDESEYTEGTGITFKLLNTTNSPIKYVWIYYYGLNSVDDKVVDWSNQATKTVQCIGPINPHTISTYTFNYVWHNDLVQYSKISQIKIQYMNGTTKLITTPKSYIMGEHVRNIFDHLYK